jgi:hypothetical protein
MHMKNIRTILVVAGLLYTIVTIILMMNEEGLYNNLNLLSLLDYFKYWMVIGLVLIVGLIVAGTLYIRSLQQRLRKLEHEHAAVKAHVYDIEQARVKEDEEAGRRIQAFRQSIDKGNRPSGSQPADPTAPQP